MHNSYAEGVFTGEVDPVTGRRVVVEPRKKPVTPSLDVVAVVEAAMDDRGDEHGPLEKVSSFESQ